MSFQYKISWTEENWFEVIVDADSEDEAIEKINNNKYDPTTGTMIQTMHINNINKIS